MFDNLELQKARENKENSESMDSVGSASMEKLIADAKKGVFQQ